MPDPLSLRGKLRVRRFAIRIGLIRVEKIHVPIILPPALQPRAQIESVTVTAAEEGGWMTVTYLAKPLVPTGSVRDFTTGR